MVVSLLQNTITQNENNNINFQVFKLIKETTKLLNDQNESELAKLVHHPNSKFINMREVSDHFVVQSGQYVIMPCTYEPNKPGEFLLRIFTEDAVQFRAVDVPTTLQKPTSSTDKDLEKIFERATSGDDRMEAKELVNSANEILIKDGNCWIIGLETARSLILLIDDDRSGTISLIDFRRIVNELLAWKEKFKMFDVNRSGDIDTFELVQIFSSIGFSLSRKVQETIFRRYGGKKCRLSFEDFVHSCCKIVSLYGAFLKCSDNGKGGTVSLNLEDWLATTVYF